MAGNDNVQLGIDITANTEKIEGQLSRALKSVKKFGSGTETIAGKAEKALNGMFDVSSSAGQYRGLMRAAAATTKKYASATELANAELKSLKNQFDKTNLSAKTYNSAVAAQNKIIYENTSLGKMQAAALVKYNAAMQQGIAVTASTRNAAEKYKDKIKQLNHMLEVGAVDQRTFSRAVRQARNDLVAAGSAAHSAAAAHRQAANAARVQTGVYARLSTQIKGLSIGYYALGAAMAVTFAARGVKNYLDGYSSLQSQLKLIVGEHGNVNTVMRKNFELAKDTFSSFDGTVKAYARISRSVKELNKSEDDRLQVVSNINKAMAIGGTTAQEAASAIQQLGQGLASDRLAGDELKSILENAPRLAQAIADGMDVSIGKLREMGSEGELTSQRVFDALLSQTQRINAEFENIAKKIDASMVGVGNSMTLTIGKLDEIYNISGNVVAGFDGIADAIQAVPQYLTYIEAGVAAVAAAITVSLLPAMGAVAIAAKVFAVSPFGILVIGAGLAAAAVVVLSNELGNAESLTYSLSSADVNLARTTDIATKAQFGLTNALRARGREMAALDVSAAASNRLNAQNKLNDIQSKINAVPKNVDGYGEFNAGFDKQRSNLQAQYNAVNSQLGQAKKNYDDSMSNMAKISNAKIVDYSTGGGSANAGGSSGATKLAKKQAAEVVQVLKSIETPFQKMAKQGEKLQKLRDAGKLSDSDYGKALQLSVDTYKQDVRNVEQRSAGYKLQQEANGLLLANLSDSQRLENSIARINELKLAGKLTDEQAAALVAGEQSRAAKKSTGGSGGQKSTLAANDNTAMALIGQFGSEADRARAAAFGYNTELAKLNKLLALGKIDQDTYNNAVASVKGVYDKAKAAAADYGGVVGTIMDGVKDTLKGVFSEIFKNGKITMKSLGDMVNNMMNRIFDKVMGLAIDGLFSAFGFGGGGIAGARAKGGPVQGGKTYLVGENGPELFTANGSGNIIDANATAKYRGLVGQISSGSKIAFANQNAVMQNINVANEPTVNVSVIVNNNSAAGVNVRRNGSDIEIDIFEQVENGLVKRIHDGDSNLPAAVAGGF